MSPAYPVRYGPARNTSAGLLRVNFSQSLLAGY